MTPFTYDDIAGMIDHALLHPTLSIDGLIEGCKLANLYRTATVCVKPCDVKLASQFLINSSVDICTVIGFPHGANTVEIKTKETETACNDGAKEVDLVINLGRVMTEDWEYITKEIETIHKAAHSFGAKLKVIFENDYWKEGAVNLSTNEVIEKLCQISVSAGADWVKTSTGFGYVPQSDGSLKAHGATKHDVALMVRSCSCKAGVKAAGGVKDFSTLLAMRALGASRIGTSSSQKILEECRNSLSLPHLSVEEKNTHFESY